MPVQTAAQAAAIGPDDATSARDGGLLARINHAVGRRIAFRTGDIRPDRPILSITFDDFPRTAGTEGGRILEAHGVRGTFYVASGLFERHSDLWTVAGADAVMDLASRGHEMALHGHAHRPAAAMTAGDFAADLAANRAALRRLVPSLSNESYAYPYGICGLPQKRWLSRTVRASRSVMAGINAGRTDLDFLKSVEISERSLAAVSMDAWLDRLARDGGWLVLFTHDVCDTPTPFGTTARILEATVAGALDRGIAIMPVAEALDRCGIV
ncbi:polysaccharide deacetylase family protein [Phreatobacter sp.]|uniref:polysaccharide deacetylase family protein n=1 Tax=Phreatobacter sp. TaxID=1966341 RepID=UPI0022C8DE2C|nr:polysaccharide deacetylase family protein [Phreatobacter sp.]MCZ8314724.1 polysaccharide deacetylase family protein [Phreatobacter sp.]